MLRTIAVGAALFVLGIPACKKDEPKPAKVEPKPAAEPEPVAPQKPKIDLSGPVPPETNAVFFSVNGAITPIGCYDTKKKKLSGGKDCLAAVEAGSEVYLASEFSTVLDAAGAPKNSLCEVGSKPLSLATSKLDAGEAYDWAVQPKSLARVTQVVPDESKGNRAKQLSDAETEAVKAIIAKVKPRAKDGELRSHQKAELDLDGDGEKELFISAIVAHPTDPDRYLFSGLLMAPGGDLARLRNIQSSSKMNDTVTLRGAVDLDGDGKRELWVSLAFDGGSGDRLIRLGEKKIEPLAKWTCGV